MCSVSPDSDSRLTDESCACIREIDGSQVTRRISSDVSVCVDRTGRARLNDQVIGIRVAASVGSYAY